MNGEKKEKHKSCVLVRIIYCISYYKNIYTENIDRL